jgi:hypothetical protein
MAEILGKPLMPWQRLVADIAGELDDHGRPAYREVFTTVPRQQGKTVLVLAWLLHRCLMWESPQLTAYTAQTGRDARSKWLDELVPKMLKQSPLWRHVQGVVRANGQEAVKFKNDSLVRILPTSEDAGHGGTWDLAVFDEIWVDEDERREAAFRPGMSRVPDAQLLIISTAGTAASTVYNRKVARGRAAVSEDAGTGMAYFEWSAPDGFEPADAERWAEWMPAVDDGIIPHSIIEGERQALPDGEFRRAYGNQPTAGIDMVISEAVWVGAQAPGAKPAGEFTFGLDVAEDRSSASVVVHGDGVFELLAQRPGTDWVTGYVNGRLDRHGGKVVIDATGPAGALTEALDKVKVLGAREVQQACARFYDDLHGGYMRFRPDPRFDKAVRGAAKKISGDVWSWSRRASINDVTPLVAATLAWPGVVKKPRKSVAAWL